MIVLTVFNNEENIYRKLQVWSKQEAVNLAKKERIIGFPWTHKTISKRSWNFSRPLFLYSQNFLRLLFNIRIYAEEGRVIYPIQIPNSSY